MRRAFVIGAWLAGTIIPLVTATVFYFGCCVLPFHRVLHKVAAPLCHVATSPQSDEEVPPPAPVKRITAVAPHAIRLASINATVVAPPIPRITSYRDFLSHGAVRCDRDVGLHVLVETFRI